MSKSKNRPEPENDLDSSPESEPVHESADELSGSSDPVATIADYEQRLQEAENRSLRSQAELENFRRRTRREMDEQLKYATLPLITDLLDVIDNFNRALSAGEASGDQGLLDGLRMVRTQLEQVLEKHGCRRIPALNLPFDPNVHSAVEMKPSDAPANTVIAEARVGYMLHDRVVRPAHVAVSTGPAT